MEKIKIFCIIAILFLFSFFALTFKLGENPPGIYVDEAVTGYNAYSILKTGKDEYGKDFPVAFRFFGSYSPPLYVYLTTIPVYFFGLNEFSVRVVSAILGSLMVVVIYIFLKSSGWFEDKVTPLLLFLFIITPWNFFYARTGYEIYSGFFLFSLGAFFLWIGLKRKIFIALGIIILSISTYGSHQQIYSAPLFLILYLSLFLKILDRNFLIAALVFAALIQIPHLFLITTQAFINKGDLFYFKEIMLNADKIFLPKILSVPLSFLFSFLARVSAYFSPANLFFLPDPDPQRSIPELSVFYNWYIFPFFVGIFALLKKIATKFTKFLLILSFAAVLPASLTKDPFSTQRALGLLLPLFLVIALGLQLIANKMGFKKFVFLFFGLFIYSCVYFWRSYFVLLPSERAIDWNYGFKDLARIISENPDKTFVIDQGGGKPSYIELAFFLKTDPEILQKATDPNIRSNYYNSSSFRSDYKFLNIDIRKVIWESDIYKKQVLVGSDLLVSETQARDHFLTEMFVVLDPRGYPIFKGFTTDPQTKCRETNFGSIFCKAFELNTMKL